jgi:DNA-binding MarR family transcriptional regulator
MMNDPSSTQRMNDIIQAYLDLGSATRMASLPNWITTEMTLSQLKTIILLEFYGPMTVSELARRLGVGNPAASLLVQQLVEQELVERSEDSKDRRRTYVRPTARGSSLIAARREMIKVSLGRWLNRLGDEDLVSLQRGLDALLRVAQEEERGS